MLRNFTLVTIIVLSIFSFPVLADSLSIQERFKAFVRGTVGADQVPQLFTDLGKLPEQQVSKIILSEFPISEIIKEEKRMIALNLALAIQKHGNPNFTGYIIQTLNLLQEGPHDSKPLLLYSFMKAGSANKDRVEKFLMTYKATQTDADTLHAIGVLEESLPALLQLGEHGDPTDIDAKKRMSELNKMLKTVWYQCPEKVWSPSIPHKPQALFKDDNSRSAWLINETGLQDVPSIPSRLDYDYKFEMSYFGKRPVIAIGLQRTLRADPYYKGSYGLYLALHEGFHQFVQTGSWKREGNGQRGERFPGQDQARYYRRMAYEFLKKAVLDNENSNHIKKAAFWYNKWKNEFASEIPQVVDRHEGTAMYYDVMAVARAHQGCGANSGNILGFIQNNYDMLFETPTDTDKEGYNIGGLAGVLLWLQGKTNWQDRVVKGASPVDLLFEGVIATTDSDNSVVLREVRARVTEKNEEISSQLHGDLEYIASRDYVRVTIPHTYENKSMPVANFVIPHSIPNSVIWIVDEGFVSGTNNGLYVKAVGLLPLFNGLESPCENFGGTFLIHGSQVRENNGVFTARNQYVDFRVQGKYKSTEGKKWLCSQ